MGLLQVEILAKSKGFCFVILKVLLFGFKAENVFEIFSKEFLVRIIIAEETKAKRVAIITLITHDASHICCVLQFSHMIMEKILPKQNKDLGLDI